MENVAQKRIYFPIILALALFIVWQLFIMLNKQAMVPSVSNAPLSPVTLPARAVPGVKAKPTVATTQKITVPAATPKAEQPQDHLIHPSLSTQQLNYLKLVNAYKISEIKRMIAQDNEAIQIANQHAAKAKASTLQILAKMDDAPAALPVASKSVDAFVSQSTKLLYTGKQYGLWTATLKYHGQLHDVVTGSVLQDGAEVIGIDKDTVILSKGQKRSIVSFYQVVNEVIPPAKVVDSKPVVSKSKPVSTVKAPVVARATKPIVSAKPNTTLAKQPVAAKVPTQLAVTKVALARPMDAKRPVRPAVSDKAPRPQRRDVPAIKPASPVTRAMPSSTNITKPTASHINHTSPAPQWVATVKPLTHATLSPVAVSHPLVKTPLPTARVATRPSMTFTPAEQAILSHDGSHYTIQLMANTRKSILEDYVSKHHLSGKTFIYQTAQHGLPWYVLAYSHFDTKEQALIAVRKLPIGYHKYTPFPKKLQAVQAEIKQKQG